MKKGEKKLGIWMLTTLVSGNMIGSGIFLLPASLASLGSISLFSWIFTALGAFALAMVFSKMSLWIPKTGGPYAYAYKGFGRFIGFQTAYNYWLAVWIGNAAIVLALVGYLRVFFPALADPMMACLFSIGIVWILTYVNILGMQFAGAMQIVTTILKLVPILLIVLFGWSHFSFSYLTDSFNVSGTSNLSAFSSGAAFTLWAFIGLESATVPAGSVDNPKRNIPLATFLGTLIASVVYIVSSFVIMGMIPADVLAHSTSPFAAAAEIIIGPWGNIVIALGAAIACFGCLNGWILLQGQVAMAAADDGLFPAIFGKKNRANIPAKGIVITSLLISALLLLTSSPNLIKQFNVVLLMATLATLIPYFYTAVSEIILLRKGQKGEKRVALHVAIALFAALYSLWAILGSGEKTIFYGTILLLSSVFLYVAVKQEKEAV